MVVDEAHGTGCFGIRQTLARHLRWDEVLLPFIWPPFEEVHQQLRTALEIRHGPTHDNRELTLGVRLACNHGARIDCFGD